MGDQAPRSRRCEPSATPERDRGRAHDRGPRRRHRVLVAVAGCLVGPGYWLCGAVWDGHPFGRSPAEVHFTEFVLASVVVVIASWGLLLILGEALLFSLAIFRAYDKEQYDIYRNLMILWGYVLTLGIPRHFRRLPAQFGALEDDVRGSHRDGGREPGPRDRRRPDDRRYRDREDPRDHTDCRRRKSDRGGPWDHEDARDHAPCREGTSPRRRPSQGPPEQERGRDERRRREECEDAPRRERDGRSRRTNDRRVARGPEEGKRPAGPGVPPEKPAAALGGVADNPLGPIFPPRPAIEAGTALPPPAGPATPAAPLADALAAAETIPNANAELRDALGLLLRYAAHFGAVETPPPAPRPGTLGIAAEATGGDG